MIMPELPLNRHAAGTVVMAAMLTMHPGRAIDERRLLGFSLETAHAELQWEEQFRTVPNPDTLRESMRRLSARPHHVGSPYDKENAEWILARFKSFGLEAHIEQFDVLFPTPLERAVELVAPTRFVARLEEPALPGDPTSNQKKEQLPSYNAYSIDGDVTAPLVYVNRGVPADYEELDRRGISVRGAIVIVRYGGSWRGIKPKVAAEHGAVGCLIFSDPGDDGYGAGVTFPSGPFRPHDGVQRGSVADIPTYSGDPMTPGVGAVPGAKRLSLAEVTSLTRIPVLPISYADATPLMAAITGPVAPEGWRGGLPLTYRMGPGTARVHLKVRSDWRLRPIYDVIATIPGSEAKDEWIIRGNHHDAWVNGAQDPISGQVALLEEARGFGELLRHGWRPRRTIIYAAWDGEEPGLLGSTEWVETHAEELDRHAAVYINSDVNGRGVLNMGGSGTLERFINSVAQDISDPETGLTAWKRLQLGLIRFGSAEGRKEARSRADLRLDPLGSGSDFTPFLQHLGIATLDLSYGGEDDGGIYHSIYDDFWWFTHFSDTSFVYGQALAQTVGTAIMRLADAEVLPIQFNGLADNLRRYGDEVARLVEDRRETVSERNRQLDEGVYPATSDPRLVNIPPEREADPPYLNFAPLQNALEALTRSAGHYDSVFAAIGQGDGAGYGRAAEAGLNAQLLASERRLTSPEGLPNRPWYRHLVYAPGFYTGYAVKTLPGIREAIEQKNWSLAESEVNRAAAALRNETALIDTATTLLSSATS
jgi:N-acetylated-alpha-linked acidic dipeptidase